MGPPRGQGACSAWGSLPSPPAAGGGDAGRGGRQPSRVLTLPCVTPELCCSQPWTGGSCNIRKIQKAAENCCHGATGPAPLTCWNILSCPGRPFLCKPRRERAFSESEQRGETSQSEIAADQRGIGLEASSCGGRPTGGPLAPPALHLIGLVCSPRLGFPGLGVRPFLPGPGSGLHTTAACCRDPRHQSPLVPAALKGVLSEAGAGPIPQPRPLLSRPAPQPATAGSLLPVLPSMSAGSMPAWAPARRPCSPCRCGAAGAPSGAGADRLALSFQQVKLEEYGRPKIDGELKVRSIVNHTKQDR